MMMFPSTELSLLVHDKSTTAAFTVAVRFDGAGSIVTAETSDDNDDSVITLPHTV
jgi:hypothetical protein